MIYRCQKISIEKLPVASSGIIPSLCDACITRDCDNPIKPVQISVMGISKKCRAYVVNGRPHFVYECEGFIHKGQVKKDVIQPILEIQTENESEKSEDDSAS